MEEPRERGAVVAELIEKRTRETDATAVLVIERADVWSWIIGSLLVGLMLGMALGSILS